MRRAPVLVVEDHLAVGELIEYTLEQAGYPVLRAASAEEAIERVREDAPILALIDWNLPGMSGLALAKHLRREPLTARLPMIIVTARIAEDDRRAAFDCGVRAYITKPFSPRVLVAHVQSVLNQGADLGTIVT